MQRGPARRVRERRRSRRTLDYDLLYPLAGPIMVAGAEPGDAVELEILDYRPGHLGLDERAAAVRPARGRLPGLPRAPLGARDGAADFLGAATVPLRPFLGVMGATPDSDEPLSPFPPGHFGGNIDTRDLVAGTSVFLPVSTPGARMLLGDPHAAQGDGEVCGAAIEASLSGAIRVRLHKGRTIPAPQFRTPGPLRSGIEDKGYFATTGVGAGPDAGVAGRGRAMVDHLVRETGLAPLDAYVLCSVVVDLKITEVVDRPNWVVAAYLPLSVLQLSALGRRPRPRVGRRGGG